MLDFDPRDLDRNETRSEFDHDRHESHQHRGRTQNTDADHDRAAPGRTHDSSAGDRHTRDRHDDASALTLGRGPSAGNREDAPGGDTRDRDAGVCVPRQYASFAGIANGGEKCNGLFDKLIHRGYAVVCDCVRNRARLYHIHYKPLYRAIGEPESRYRRPVPARRAAERLMLLDAVLASPEYHWLTTEVEKVGFCADLMPPQPTTNHPAELSVAVPSRGAGTFLRIFPIGVDASGRVLLLYLAAAPWTNEFRTFLQAHAALLRVASQWTLRLVFPRPLDRGYSAFQEVIHQELEMPLHRATVNELRWYFVHRQKAASGPVDTQTQAFLNRAAQVYGAPRFTLLYRRWLKHGDTVFRPPASPVIAEAPATGTARVECLVLPHTYRHLSPLVNRVRPASKRVEQDAGQQGLSCATRTHPRPQARGEAHTRAGGTLTM